MRYFEWMPLSNVICFLSLMFIIVYRDLFPYHFILLKSFEQRLSHIISELAHRICHKCPVVFQPRLGKILEMHWISLLVLRFWGSTSFLSILFTGRVMCCWMPRPREYIKRLSMITSHVVYIPNQRASEDAYTGTLNTSGSEHVCTKSKQLLLSDI